MPITRTHAGTHAPTHCVCVLRWYTHSRCATCALGFYTHARVVAAEQSTHSRPRTRTRARSSARVASRRGYCPRFPDPPGRRRRAARRTIPPPTEWPARPVDGTGSGRRIGRVRMAWLKAGGWRGACAGLQIAPRRSVGQAQPTEGRVGVTERGGDGWGATVWVGGARPVWGGDCPRTAWLSCRCGSFVPFHRGRRMWRGRFFIGFQCQPARSRLGRVGARDGGGVCGGRGERGADATPHTSSASTPS